MNRNAHCQSQQHRSRIRRRAREAGAVDFFNMLAGPELLEVTDSYLPEHCERLYPPTVTLSMFMEQVLAADRSCQRAVDTWAAQRAAEGLSVQSTHGAYCQARQRLALEMLAGLTRETARLLSDQEQTAWRWRGRATKLADGTGILMPVHPRTRHAIRSQARRLQGWAFRWCGWWPSSARRLLGGGCIAGRCPILQLLHDRDAAGGRCGCRV
jgi:hypothetical protein